MKEIEVKVLAKDGAEKTGRVLVPETLDELVTVMGERKVFHAALTQYMSKSKRRIATGSKPRSRRLTLRMADLSAQQKAHLKAAGLLKDED